MVDLRKEEIAGVSWMKVPRGYQFGVRVKDGISYKFIGFREQVFLSPPFSLCVLISMNR